MLTGFVLGYLVGLGSVVLALVLGAHLRDLSRGTAEYGWSVAQPYGTAPQETRSHLATTEVHGGDHAA
jgi:hypothetical protein